MSALNVNRVCLAGHLTRDPVLRRTASGTAVADLGLAVNESYSGKDGNVVQQTCFVDVVAWARSAEAAHTHLHKGDPLLVEGALAFDQWETEKGEKRSRLRVRAARLHFIGTRRAATSPDDSASPDADREPGAAATVDEAIPF